MSSTLERIVAETGLFYKADGPSVQGFLSDCLFYVTQNESPAKSIWVGTWVTAQDAAGGEALARLLTDFVASSGGRAFDASWSGDAENLYGVVSISFRDLPGEEEETLRWVGNYIRQLQQLLVQHRFVTKCIECGTHERVGLYMIGGEAVVCQCEACHENFCEQSKKTEPLSGKNWGMGLLGAVLGGMIGVALWVAVGLAGYIAAIAGYVIAACCFHGFTYLGGTHNLRSVIVCSLIAVVMCVGAVFLTYGIEIHIAVTKEYPEVAFWQSAIVAYEILMESSEAMQAVGKNLLIGLALGGISIFGFFKSWHTAFSQGVQRETLVPPQRLQRAQTATVQSPAFED